MARIARNAAFAALLTTILILGGPPPQCRDITFARANPQLCDQTGSPFGVGGAGGGHNGGGLGGLLHTLTGGLL